MSVGDLREDWMSRRSNPISQDSHETVCREYRSIHNTAEHLLLTSNAFFGETEPLQT